MAYTKFAFASTFKTDVPDPRPTPVNPYQQKLRTKREPGRWLGLSSMTCRDFSKFSYDYRDGAPDLSDRGRFYRYNAIEKPKLIPDRTKLNKTELRFVPFSRHPECSYNPQVRLEMRASTAAELYGCDRNRSVPARINRKTNVQEPMTAKEAPQKSEATTQVPNRDPRFQTEYSDTYTKPF